MNDSGEPSGPMLNGTTYIVRPRIEPANSFWSRARISDGSSQLLVGPASASRSEHTNVRSSTRATSPGSDAAQYEPGRLAGSSSTSVPASTSCFVSSSYSSSDPSNHWTESGSQRATISFTQPRSFSLRVGGAFSVTATTPTPCGETVRPAYRWAPKPAEPSRGVPGDPLAQADTGRLTPARASGGRHGLAVVDRGRL